MKSLARISGTRALLSQLVFVGITALLFAVFSCLGSANSVLLGGLAWFLPSICFVVIFLFRSPNRSPVQIMIDFFIGEAVKFILSVILIIIMLKFFPIIVLPFICGYIAAVLSIWLLPFIGPKVEKK